MVKSLRSTFAAALMALLLSPLQLSAQAQDSDARLEIQINRVGPTPVVGEMILVTLRGYYDLSIARNKFEIPRLDDFDWIQLVRDRWFREVVEGKEIQIAERKLAFFPKRSGKLKLGPFTHSLTVADLDNKWTVRDIVAEPITVRVAPRPGPQDGWWLPARELEITDTWNRDPSTLRDGETVTRSVRLSVLGVLPPVLPPRPEMRERWLITFSAPEKRSVELTPNGPISTVDWSWELRPITGEPGVIRRYPIIWFDTKSRRFRESEIEPAPFGYASFERSIAAAPISPAQGIAILAAALGAGMLVVVMLLLKDLRLAGRTELKRRLALILPSKDAMAMRRASRHKKPDELRFATKRYLESRGIAVTGSIAMALAELDRHVYGRDGEENQFDYDGFLAAVLKPDRT